MSLLSDKEVEELLLGFSRARGEQGFTEAEAKELVAWCESVRGAAIAINLASQGLADLSDWSGSVDFVLKARR